ncbi:hypothetical protein Rhal01_02570 [Rubritalea halochordaticola]|uniref:Uncharacterized protein n=1 Tax=Rubritalea halochordaticola TaxID=714537 RepID=A0ABP9V6Y9_9BACT
MLRKSPFRLFGLLILLCVIAYAVTFFVSAQIPERWQELSSGMKREDVKQWITPTGDTLYQPSHGQDTWLLDRPIGQWKLIVSYNEDDTFNRASLLYSSPLFGEYTRARHYAEYDRATNKHN